jgi:hypothetical protein
LRTFPTPFPGPGRRSYPRERSAPATELDRVSLLYLADGFRSLSACGRVRACLAIRVSNEDTLLLGINQQRPTLEQAEQFKDHHDNDNYSDYVEDVSVHGGDRY